jgi:hypothetical protein
VVCEVAAADPPATVRRKVATRLTDLSAELSDDLRVSVLAALGLHPAAKHQFMQDRMHWAAHQINRDHPGAAIRRMRVGFGLLARQLAVDPKADQGWWPPLSPAVQVAQQARTKEEFGAALDLLRRSRGLSLNTLGRRLADARQWIGKSTLSRACSGRTLFRDREKIAAFVNACGVEHEIEVWEKAWERASEHARQDKSADPHTAQVCGAGLYANTSAGATPPDSDVVDLNTLGAGGPGELLPSGAGASGDDVVGEVCVRFSRRHLRTAVVLLAASAPTTAGLTVSAGSNTETVVLAIATGLALYEYVQTLSDPSLGAAPSGA